MVLRENFLQQVVPSPACVNGKSDRPRVGGTPCVRTSVRFLPPPSLEDVNQVLPLWITTKNGPLGLEDRVDIVVSESEIQDLMLHLPKACSSDGLPAKVFLELTLKNAAQVAKWFQSGTPAPPDLGSGHTLLR